MKKIAIMASGNGSNAENIIHHFYHNHKIKIALVLTNKADAYVIQRAKNHHIRCYVFTAKQLNETDLVIEKLKDMKIDTQRTRSLRHRYNLCKVLM